MQWSDINFSPDRKLLRRFAGLWVIVFSALAWIQYGVQHRPVAAAAMAALALTIGPLGLIRPEAVKHIFVGWSILAFPIGFCVSWMALALLFYGIFTPIGFAFRLAGRDALGRRRRVAQSYWIATRTRTDPTSYLRQF